MSPFRSTAFRWLCSATAAANGAQQMERTATAWLALQTGGGAFAVGLVFAARPLPSLLFGLASGTVADRVDRRRHLLIVAAAACALMAGFGVLVAAGSVAVWQVIALSFAAGCVQVSDTPARQALVVDTITRETAPRALALAALVSRGAGAVGAVAAGALIVQFGVAQCYGVVATLYGIGGLVLTALRVPQRERGTVALPPFGQALRGAVRLITGVPAVGTLMLSGIAAEILAFSYQSALPVFSRDVLRVSAEGLGTMNAASAIGGAVALLLLATVAGRVRRELLLGAAFATFGASLVALSITRDVRAAVAVLVITGVCAGTVDNLQQTLLQLAVPEEQRGRAVGIWTLGVGSAPVGHLETGTLIATLGAPAALLINGTLATATAVILLIRAPGLRRKVPVSPGAD